MVAVIRRRWAVAMSFFTVSSTVRPQTTRTRDYLRRSRVLVVCGRTVDETVKNDIATAQRLRITATTLDGIQIGRASCRERV